MFTTIKKQIQQNRVVLFTAMALLGLIVLALVFSQPIWTVAKVVAGIVLSLFLPGFFLTLTLFPEATTWDDLGREGGSNGMFIDPVEKIVFSLFFSMAMVAISFTVLRQVGVIFSPAVVFVVVLSLNIITMVTAWLRRKKK